MKVSTSSEAKRASSEAGSSSSRGSSKSGASGDVDKKVAATDPAPAARKQQDSSGLDSVLVRTVPGNWRQDDWLIFLTIVGSVVLLIILAFLIFFAVKKITIVIDRERTKRPELKQLYCNSTRCKVFSRDILGFLDWHGDPCKDFFAYVCSGFNRESSHSFTYRPTPNSEYSRLNQFFNGRFKRGLPVSEGLRRVADNGHHLLECAEHGGARAALKAANAELGFTCGTKEETSRIKTDPGASLQSHAHLPGGNWSAPDIRGGDGGNKLTTHESGENGYTGFSAYHSLPPTTGDAVLHTLPIAGRGETQLRHDFQPLLCGSEKAVEFIQDIQAVLVVVLQEPLLLEELLEQFDDELSSSSSSSSKVGGSSGAAITNSFEARCETPGEKGSRVCAPKAGQSGSWSNPRKSAERLFWDPDRNLEWGLI
ncbi:hypothetical protein ISCGN_013195 [Ixodes scapularis]